MFVKDDEVFVFSLEFCLHPVCVLAILLEQTGDFGGLFRAFLFYEITDLLPAVLLVLGGADAEVAPGEVGQFGEEGVFFAREERTMDYFLFGSPDQRIGGDDLEIQVGQGLEAAVGLLGPLALVHQQGDEEAQFGDLGGNGLDVHAVETLGDDAQLADVVPVLPLQLAAHLAPQVFGEAGDDLLEPALVVGIEFVQDVDHLLQGPHGEGAGAAGRVEEAQAVQGVDEDIPLFLIEEVLLFVVFEQEGQIDVGISLVDQTRG